MRKKWTAAIALCFALTTAGLAFSQPSGAGGSGESKPGAAKPEAASWTLSGIVVNLGNGSPLTGATVSVDRTEAVATTDMDGIFNIDLPAGQYDLLVLKEGFRDQQIKDVQVKTSETTFQDVAVAPQGLDLGQVTVVAESEKASQIALLTERRTSAVISDTIGSQEISKSTGGDAADVIQRVTGVTVVDNKYVFVRGLGERYSSTMLNGSVVPSTQPDKKVVPLDLFPASLLQNIQTEKSYTPDKPGEFSGGLVKLSTVDFPRAPLLKVSVGQGFGTITTFKDFISYRGGSYDFLGRHQVTLEDRPLDLTATEFNLLSYLLRHDGRVLTRERLLESVWGYRFGGTSRTVDTYIQRLRQKLGKHGDSIQTVRGVGYRIASEANG